MRNLKANGTSTVISNAEPAYVSMRGTYDCSVASWSMGVGVCSDTTFEALGRPDLSTSATLTQAFPRMVEGMNRMLLDYNLGLVQLPIGPFSFQYGCRYLMSVSMTPQHVTSTIKHLVIFAESGRILDPWHYNFTNAVVPHSIETGWEIVSIDPKERAQLPIVPELIAGSIMPVIGVNLQGVVGQVFQQPVVGVDEAGCFTFAELKS